MRWAESTSSLSEQALLAGGRYFSTNRTEVLYNIVAPEDCPDGARQ